MTTKTKENLPQCDGPDKCPLGIEHKPNGEEFSLGCSLCRGTENIVQKDNTLARGVNAAAMRARGAAAAQRPPMELDDDLPNPNPEDINIRNVKGGQLPGGNRNKGGDDDEDNEKKICE